MDRIFHVNSIAELHRIFEYPPPNHPLISIIDLSQISLSDAYIGTKTTASFYTIALKLTSKQTFKYGKELFDFDNGCLYGLAPDQIGEVIEGYTKGEMEGWALYFHPDLIHNYELNFKIHSYDFFGYNTFEALHISAQERTVLLEIFNRIRSECNINTDVYSQDILVANIALLLDYIKRYYHRQFITRKKKSTTLVNDFKDLLHQTIHSSSRTETKIPTVAYFAKALHLSPAYFSDLLKKETGKSPLEHIHYAILKKAKVLLLNNELSISEIAYRLGFEYPTYFTRLFKNKTGITPGAFRNQLN